MEFSHVPVLFEETVSSLRIKPDGVYADCTAGGGGHASAIADRLSEKGRLIAIDRDPDAIAHLRNKFEGRDNVILIHDNYLNIKNIIDTLGFPGADGILADLGVSSFQLDAAERGFSFHLEAPLDMRMSKEGKSAYDVVNTYSEADLRRILYAYGEEKFAPGIAKRIVAARAKKPIESTLELAEIIKSGIPARARREGGHPARRSFQAIRIEVNGELENLTEAVQAMFDSLNVGGILSVITFHSLEDRAVKTKFRELCTGCICPPEIPVCCCGRTPRANPNGKPVTAGETELAQNPRSRSARLRSIEKLK
jgi:16S rRNA (cytosine1402-N4)-methyltransferase